eukprot:scaffold512_cov75-Cyclotella_meneghiniana.AAC.5
MSLCGVAAVTWLMLGIGVGGWRVVGLKLLEMTLLWCYAVVSDGIAVKYFRAAPIPLVTTTSSIKRKDCSLGGVGCWRDPAVVSDGIAVKYFREAPILQPEDREIKKTTQTTTNKKNEKEARSEDIHPLRRRAPHLT